MGHDEVELRLAGRIGAERADVVARVAQVHLADETLCVTLSVELD